MKHTIIITEAAQEGYEYQAGINGESVEALINRRAEEIGINYVFGKRGAELNQMIEKISKNPAAYKASIEAIAEAEQESAINRINGFKP